jgi:ABC-type transporter Mla MlaB component
MLKITTQDGAAEVLIEIEGTLAGPWVQELATSWQQATRSGQQVRVSLKAVMFVDVAGRKLLAEMHRQGVMLVASGCMTGAIIDEIKRGGKP